MSYTPRYPSPSVQHARCWRALSVAWAVFEVYETGPETSARFKKHLGKIKRWLTECWALTIRQPLIRASRLAIDRSLDKLVGRTRLSHCKTDEDKAFHWAAMVWAALTFLEDIRYTCPEYRTRPCWRYLLMTWTTLAEHLRACFPGMDEEGTAIYEAAA